MPSGTMMIVRGILLGLLLGTARAEVVVVVSADNPIESLSRTELVEIYLGRKNTFPNGQKVVPVDQRENSSVHHQFYSHYLGRTPSQVKAHWSKLIFSGRGQPPRALAGNRAVVEFVTEHRHAIGYVNSDLVDKQLRVLPIE